MYPKWLLQWFVNIHLYVWKCLVPRSEGQYSLEIEAFYHFHNHDTVIDELRKVASLYGDENDELSMAMAVYMLGFNTYMGFGDKICGELGEDKDGMLERIYEYAKKLQK